ncbi:MAG TPA: hypothetical protein VIU82_03430 [Bosea sp. (in: a-proteobacteria)]
MAQSIWSWLLTIQAVIGVTALVWFLIQLFRGRISIKALRDKNWPI